MTCSLDCKLCRSSYRITDGNCGLAKTGKGKSRSTCLAWPAYDVQRSLRRMCWPAYVVYVSVDAQSLAIQHDKTVRFSLLTLAVTQRGNEQEATKLQKQVITNDLWHCLLFKVSVRLYVHWPHGQPLYAWWYCEREARQPHRAWLYYKIIYNLYDNYYFKIVYVFIRLPVTLQECIIPFRMFHLSAVKRTYNAASCFNSVLTACLV